MAESRKSIAVFDIDGTLLPGTSAERIFLSHLMRRGELGPSSAFHAARYFINTWQRNWIAATRGNKYYLRGKSRTRLESMAAVCFAREILPRISVAGLKVIEEHRRAGRGIVLLSGTLDLLGGRFGDQLRADAVHGTTLEAEGDRLTGAITGLHPYGPRKAEIIRATYPDTHYDLSASYAYADDGSDLEFLPLFGHPFCVNPDRRTALRAAARGIETIRF